MPSNKIVNVEYYNSKTSEYIPKDGYYRIHINESEIPIVLSKILKGQETHNITYDLGLFSKEKNYNNCRIVYCDVNKQEIGFKEPSDDYFKIHTVKIKNVVNITPNSISTEQQGGKYKTQKKKHTKTHKKHSVKKPNKSAKPH